MMKRFALSILLLCLATAHASPTLTTLDGKKIDFSTLQGRWVLINYWASWCGPCLEEISELNHFYAKNKDKISLFAVNYDQQSVSEQLEISKKFHLKYPALARDPGPALRLGEIRGVPATFVFNPQGKLCQTLYGPQTTKSLANVIKTC